MKRLLPLFFVFVGLSLFNQMFAGGSVAAQQTTTPQASPPATVTIAGLHDNVTIRRDERGIPYIEATNEADLYFAQGYVAASDRLWQMDAIRRTARGELAEIFGRPLLEQDKIHRTYGFARLSEGLMTGLPEPIRAALEAYSRGVNRYIESLDAKNLPMEFQLLQYKPRSWTPADSLVVGKFFSEILSNTWQTDLMRAALSDLTESKRKMLLTESSPLDVLVVGQDGVEKKASARTQRPLKNYSREESTSLLRELSDAKAARESSLEAIGLFTMNRAASNNWVVSGKRTNDRQAMLANDPHLPPLVPSVWYLVHLSMPGLRVSGVAAPAAPGVILGHNEHIAWGVTNLGPDVQDLYLEKFDKDNPRKYQTPQGLREAEVRREEIKVRKGFTDSATDTVTIDVTITRHGPIVFEKDGARYAMRWTALEPNAMEFTAFYYINRARNWNEFQKALSRYEGPTQNFVYADKAGHIGYYGAGRVPIRKSGDGSVPYDGATDSGEWTGWIPFEKMPHVYDPPEGFIVTANQRIAGFSYPYHLTQEWAEPYRARRIYDLLKSNSKLKPSDMRDIQADTFHFGLSAFARETVKVASTEANSATANETKWRESVKLFEGWNGRLDIESRVAPLATEMRLAFRRYIFAAALGPDRAKSFGWANDGTFLDRLITERPNDWLPAEFKNYSELLQACELDARMALEKRLGKDETKWTWGNYRPVTIRHPLASIPLIGNQFVIAPYPQNGGEGVVNLGSWVSMRVIAIPNAWDESRQGIGPGQSGDPSSPHYKDQLEDWRNVRPGVFPFTKAAVEKAARPVLIMVPAKKIGTQ